MLAVWLKTVSLFSRREKARVATLFALSVLLGLLQLGGVASIMPFVAALTSPSLVDTQPFLARVYDFFGFTSYRDFVIALGFFSFGVLVVGHLAELAYSWVSVKFINLKEYELSTALLESYLTSDFERISRRNTSELGKTILEDVEKVVTGIVLSGMNIATSALSALLIVGLLLFVDPWITLSIALVFLTCYGAIFLFLSPRIRKLGGEVRNLYAEMYINAQQGLDGLKEIKANNRESHFVRKYAVPRKASALNFIRYTAMELIPKQLLEITAFGVIIGISLFLLYRAANPGVDYSILAMFAFAAYRILPELKAVFDGMEAFNYYRTFIDGLWEDLDRTRNTGGARPARAIDHSPIRRIELRDVAFRYTSQPEPILKDVSLMLAAGERVCLAGPSGAGKTTTVNILLGLLVPERGSVLVNGERVATGDHADVREHIGYVPQSPYLLDDDLKSNIVFGDDDADRERLAWAYEKAGLADVFGAFTDAALLTRIGQGGARVSAGERQRIAIARALYKRPDVLILDESTNELDLATERVLLTNLASLEGTVMLFVSHRPSVMSFCDRVIVVDGGEVVGRGSLAELARDPHCRMLVSEPAERLKAIETAGSPAGGSRTRRGTLGSTKTTTPG